MYKLLFVLLLGATVEGEDRKAAGVRIVGGSEAGPGEFPHQAAVLLGVSLVCSGALVRRDMVLTAGHCCHGSVICHMNLVHVQYIVLVCDRQVARNMKVRVGSYHLYVEDEGQTDIAVSTIHLHPDYDAWTLDHDLCILALAHKADTSRPTIGLVSLPAAGEQVGPGTVCLVSGWGVSWDPAAVLLKAEVAVLSPAECLLAYDGVGITDTVLCAGGAGSDFCDGDSGRDTYGIYQQSRRRPQLGPSPG